MAPDAATRMKADGALSRIGTGRNIFSNLIGGAWIAALTLIITPMQVNILGMEAYGLVGFIMTLQMVFSVFDLGLSTTVIRELARDQSARHADTLPLLQTASTIYWILAIVLGAVLMVLAEPLAKFWFNPKSLDLATLEQGIRVIAIYLALRWPVALYSGILSGLRRMDILNVVKALASSIRLVGGIIVLYIMRDLESFLWWTAFSSLIEVLAFVVCVYWLHPAMSWMPRISLQAARDIWRFALSMNALALIALLTVQADRLIISKLLPLEQLGFYSLAYSTVSSISLILTAIGSAMLPSFASAFGAGRRDIVGQRYDMACRVMMYAVGFPAFALIFFGKTILTWWVGIDAASGAWLSLALLAAGFWLGAAYTNAYNLLVASGRTFGVLVISLGILVPYILALYLMVQTFSIAGAALAWLILTVFYALTIIPAMHRVAVDSTFMSSLRTIFIPFLLTGAVCFGAPKLVAEYFSGSDAKSLVHVIMLSVAVLIYAAIGYRLLGVELRVEVQKYIARFIPGVASL